VAFGKQLIPVAEEEHGGQVAFVLGGEAALGGEVVGFAEGSEEAVPPGNVAEVEFVDVKLVMDGMVFGALEEVADSQACTVERAHRQ
jgi:hypothetical protein